MFASTYLQDNLLGLPSLPNSHQLAEIRQKKEEEARERLKEIERQRELLRLEEASRRAPQVVMATTREEEGDEDEREFAGASYSSDTATGLDKKKRFEKLKNFSNKVIPKVTFKKEEGGRGGREGRVGSGSGWIGMSRAFGSVDSQDDPFSLQRDQLLGYIDQARAAGRGDEVAALEQSLCEIERLMVERAHPEQPPLAYGFD